MPSAADFKRAFGLTTGSEVGQFAVTTSSVGHEVTQENERYEFPGELTLEWKGGGPSGAGTQGKRRAAELQRAFGQHTRQRHIVYSPYGSPYECTCSAPSVRSDDAEGQRFTVACRGAAVRRRDIPTLAQQKAEERRGRGAPQDVSPEDKQRYLRGYRLIKSRFGSGKCGVCESTIDQGERIAKRQGEDTRGGWSHATCLVRQLKEGGGEGEEAEEQEEEGSGGKGEEEEEEMEAVEDENGEEARAASGGKRKRQPAGRGKQRPGSKRTHKSAAKGSLAHAAAGKGTGRGTRARAEE